MPPFKRTLLSNVCLEFHVVLFIMLIKVKCDYEFTRAIKLLSCGVVYYAVQGGFNF